MIDKHRVTQLLHKKCRPDHTEDRHRYDAIVYTNFLNDRGLDWPEERVVGAIMAGVELAALLCDPSCCHGCEVCINFGCRYDSLRAGQTVSR